MFLGSVKIIHGEYWSEPTVAGNARVAQSEDLFHV